MGRSWEYDERLIRPEHKWVFSSAEQTEWGASVTFYCANPGCPTTLSVPCKPEDDFGGVCFNASRGVEITDRETP